MEPSQRLRSPVAARLGRTIRIARRNAGMTQADLAQAIERCAFASGRDLTCDRSAVSHWERGDWCPDVRLMPCVAGALNIPIDLFRRIEEEGAAA